MSAESNPISTGAVHHLRLTVTDVQRSQQFYTGVLGFQVAMELPPGVLLTNGTVLLGLAPSPDPGRASSGDRFDENRVGLDHLSFTAGNRDELERAVQVFNQHGVQHSGVVDLGAGLGLYVLPFRDPDGIQLEITAPWGLLRRALGSVGVALFASFASRCRPTQPGWLIGLPR
ncbi:MAG: VOC family protein [Chloroflexota bacterium]|nr:VOC family protein [Chloroflexota bacterium]